MNAPAPSSLSFFLSFFLLHALEGFRSVWPGAPCRFAPPRTRGGRLAASGANNQGPAFVEASVPPHTPLPCSSAWHIWKGMLLGWSLPTELGL
ncbi:hypothetical protein F5Y15DRAFT_366022 [Xylariaceae sp. FL0016]|nr:hypothetical protein F5Y15DRAFT_366022 [Xylariaceae sp. FL0016]